MHLCLLYSIYVFILIDSYIHSYICFSNTLTNIISNLIIYCIELLYIYIYSREKELTLPHHTSLGLIKRHTSRGTRITTEKNFDLTRQTFVQWAKLNTQTDGQVHRQIHTYRRTRTNVQTHHWWVDDGRYHKLFTSGQKDMARGG